MYSKYSLYLRPFNSIQSVTIYYNTVLNMYGGISSAQIHSIIEIFKKEEYYQNEDVYSNTRIISTQQIPLASI